MLPAQLCTVFAQLTVGGKWEGPHVFAVRIRDDAGRVTPGVRIKDNGHKAGLNGVDNGQIWHAAFSLSSLFLLFTTKRSGVGRPGTECGTSCLPLMIIPKYMTIGILVSAVPLKDIVKKTAILHFQWRLAAGAFMLLLKRVQTCLLDRDTMQQAQQMGLEACTLLRFFLTILILSSKYSHCR